MLARMARRASLTLRKRRSSRMDSLGNHYRESMSSVFVEDKMGTIIAAILHGESTGTELDILMVVAFTPSAKPPPSEEGRQKYSAVMLILQDSYFNQSS